MNLKTKSTIVVKVKNKDRLEIPNRVFSTAAESLRWDAIRSGELSFSDWPNVQAFVSTIALDKEEPTREFALAIVIEHNGKAIRRIYKPGELESFRVYVEAMSGGLRKSDRIELYMERERRLRVPLAKLALPFTEAVLRHHGSVRQRDLEPPRLVVSHGAMKKIRNLYRESRLRKIELGGCLLGQVPNSNTIIVSDVMIPEFGQGSPDRVKFNPMLWIKARQFCKNTGDLMTIGWIHSHLVDERGHPPTLSFRDKIIAHKFFYAPWSVSAMVLVREKSPGPIWYLWENGALKVREKEPECCLEI